MNDSNDPYKLVPRRGTAFTEELPQSVELHFHRDGWTNRIVTDKEGNALYFADIPWKWAGTTLNVYRGSPDDQKALASLSRKSLNKRAFYHLKDNKCIEIVGSRWYLGFDYLFDFNGRQYRWREGFQRWKKKGRDEVLTDVETKEVIARFKNASPCQVWRRKQYGKLVLYNEAWKVNSELLDVAVLTLIAVKQQIREKLQMRTAWEFLAAAGEGAGGN